MFASLVLGATVAFQQRRQTICGGLLGLAFLCRYDAALLGVVLAAAYALRREWPTRVVLSGAVVVLPWLITASAYFGSFLPHTFFAKQRITPFWDYLEHYANHLAAAPVKSFIAVGSGELATACCVLVSGAGLWSAYRSARDLIWPAVYSLLLVFAYAQIGPARLQHWHLFITEFMYRVLFILGLLTLTSSALRRVSKTHADRWLVVGTALLAVKTTASLVLGAEPLVQSFWLGERHRRYEAVSQWITDNTVPEASVLAPEFGTLGYHTRRRMIDAGGLINRTNDFPREPSNANLAGLARVFRPSIILLDSPRNAWAIEQMTEYRTVKVFETDPWSTVLIHDASVLRTPHAMAELRAQLPSRARAEGLVP